MINKSQEFLVYKELLKLQISIWTELKLYGLKFGICFQNSLESKN
jgi:hypothetical protein